MNYCSHDPAACIAKINIENGNIEYIFAEEGFLSRRKKSYHFPFRAIKFCLDHFGIKIDNIDRICLDYMDNKRINRTSNNYRLLVGDYIRANLKISNKTKISFCESHHLAHAYTAFIPSSYQEAAIVIIDGLGSQQQTHSIFKANRNNINLVATQKGNGIGELYSLVTQKLGFDHGEEGKTMGLAPYGKNHQDQDENLPNLRGEKLSYFCDYGRILNRHPSPSLKFKLKPPKHKKDLYNPFYSRLAYNLQSECEEAVRYIMQQALEITGYQNICFAGGVALNCVANELISKDIKHNLFVQPASGDTGIPFGLALYGAELELGNLSSVKLDNKHQSSKKDKYFVPYISDEKNRINNEIKKFDNGFINNIIKTYSNRINIDEIASLLSKGKVGCIYHKAIEMGPRALGHRSFIADAREQSMKEIMNMKVKHRESYRPFAPIILENDFDDFFIGKAFNLYKYMLGAVKCKKKCHNYAPAIVHIDNTARVQTVNESNGLIFEILKKYKSITEIPILINTSFNDNNEPIVFSHQDAIICFLRTNADFLIIDNKIINRNDIKNISSLSKIISEKQKAWIRYYSKKAIKEITHIGDSEKTVSIKDFLKLNLKLTNSFKNDFPILNLIEFLSKNKNRRLITDLYHFRLINNLSRVYPSSNFLNYVDIHLVEDDLSSLNIIKSEDSVILYNLSIYLEKEIYSFYKSYSKILSFEIKEVGSNDDINSILSSYEVDLEKNIEDSFDNLY